MSSIYFDGQDSRPYRTHIQFLRKVRGKQEKSRRLSVFILLKSNYGLSRIRPGNSVHAQRLTDSLFISFRFFDVFPKQPYRPHYTQPTPSGKPFPHFPLIFHPKPRKPDPLPLQPRRQTPTLVAAYTVITRAGGRPVVLVQFCKTPLDFPPASCPLYRTWMNWSKNSPLPSQADSDKLIAAEPHEPSTADRIRDKFTHCRRRDKCLYRQWRQFDCKERQCL